MVPAPPGWRETIAAIAAMRAIAAMAPRKCTLTTELADHIGRAQAKNEAKERIARFKTSSDDDDYDSYVESQEYLIRMIDKCNTFIADYESHHHKQKEFLKSFFLRLHQQLVNIFHTNTFQNKIIMIYSLLQFINNS